MDDLTRGLSLLGPKIEQFTRQLDTLGAQVSELKAIVARKADASEVRQFAEQLESLKGGLTKQRKGHVEKEHFDQLSSSVQELCSIVAQKAEGLKVDELDEQVRALTDTIYHKVDAVEIEQLRNELQGASKNVDANTVDSKLALKAEKSDIDAISVKMQPLIDALQTKAEASELQKLRERLSSVNDELGKKAESDTVDQFNEMIRTVNASLANKGEFTEMEQLKVQLRSLSGRLVDTCDTQGNDIHQLKVKLNAVQSAEQGAQQCQELRQQFHNGLTDLEEKLAEKADGGRVIELKKQLQVLSDHLAPSMRGAAPVNNARPRSARGARKDLALTRA